MTGCTELTVSVRMYRPYSKSDNLIEANDLVGSFTGVRVDGIDAFCPVFLLLFGAAKKKKATNFVGSRSRALVPDLL